MRRWRGEIGGKGYNGARIWGDGAPLGGSGLGMVITGGSGQGMVMTGGSGQGMVIIGGSGQGMVIIGGSGQGMVIIGGSGQGMVIAGGSGQGMVIAGDLDREWSLLGDLDREWSLLGIWTGNGHLNVTVVWLKADLEKQRVKHVTEFLYGFQGVLLLTTFMEYGKGCSQAIFADHLELLRAVEPKTSCNMLRKSLIAVETLHFERVMEFIFTNCTSYLFKNWRRKIIQAVGSSLHLQKEPELSAIISRIQCRIVALDLRGHGETKVRNPEDLSAETMSKDVGNVVEALYGDLPPPIMLIGHSMGGAIAVHTAVANLVPSLLGLCMIDVVEGTAMDALNSMQNFLRSRPKTFKSLENAIEWRCEGPASPECPKAIVEGIIEEEEEEDEDEEGGGSVNKRKKEDDTETKKEHLYTWRIELAKTEKYWDGWFRGLSNLFLSCPTPKLLLLAGVDRLDKDLTIGQMQGKFQMQVLPQCGHAVHEDAPDKVAEAVATFLIRHRFTEPIGGFQW
ncbi:hypothetical protein TURU_003269 [Turdus rufiventris]|nr:hypothetical protein TURU_003269 [Turdus rufiventris]